jgi:hypothetical protein
VLLHIEAPNFVMADLPYAIIVTGDGEVMEHKLANHNGKFFFSFLQESRIYFPNRY